MLRVDRIAPTASNPVRTHARAHEVPPSTPSVTFATGTVDVQRPSVLLHDGQEIDERYCVTGFLGKGGMGAVYRVFDRILEEEVALKLVRGDRERLREEVRLAQQVTHRNVCRTYDLEEIGGQHYVKMEYIVGDTLAKQLGRLTTARALAIVRAIADGLAAAHARGIVHRDLKPGNVMLDGERVVILDFGLAQLEGEADQSGTPAYMSPEQLDGGAIDARSDLYALGCVAFAMLAGGPPFGEGTIAQVAARRATEPIPDIRTVRRDVPRRFARAITALLATDPAARSRGLELLRERPVAVPFALAIAAVALVTIGSVAVWHKPPAAWKPTIVDLPQYDENADDPSWSPDGTAVLFSSDRGKRDIWGIYVASNDGADPRLISPPGRFCIGARWTRDGRAALISCFAGGERRILRQPIDGTAPSDLGQGWAADDCGDALAVVVTRPTGAELVLRDRAGHDTDVVALPSVSLARCDRSGQHFVYVVPASGSMPSSTGSLMVADRTGEARLLTEGVAVDYATFAADARSVVFAMKRHGKSSLYEIGVDGGDLHELTPDEEDAASPDISRDGKSLVFDRDRTALPLFELTAQGAVQKTFRYERLVHLVATPGDRELVAAKESERGTSMVAIDLQTFAERPLAVGQALFVSRTGEVVFRAPDDPRKLQTMPLTGGPITTIATLSAPILDAVDGPDGRHVELDRGGTSDAWRIDRDGVLVPEGVRGLVIPAPVGGWRVVRIADGARVRLLIVPPDHLLTAPLYERAAMWGAPSWVNDHELAYCEPSACHRLDVRTGRDLATTAIDVPGHRPITVSSDGRRWFVTSFLGHVTRHVIANFVDRPWTR